MRSAVLSWRPLTWRLWRALHQPVPPSHGPALRIFRAYHRPAVRAVPGWSFRTGVLLLLFMTLIFREVIGVLIFPLGLVALFSGPIGGLNIAESVGSLNAALRRGGWQTLLAVTPDGWAGLCWALGRTTLTHNPALNILRSLFLMALWSIPLSVLLLMPGDILSIDRSPLTFINAVFFMALLAVDHYGALHTGLLLGLLLSARECWLGLGAGTAGALAFLLIQALLLILLLLLLGLSADLLAADAGVLAGAGLSLLRVLGYAVLREGLLWLLWRLAVAAYDIPAAALWTLVSD